VEQQVEALTLLASTRTYGERLRFGCAHWVSMIRVHALAVAEPRPCHGDVAVSQLKDVVDQAKQVERQVRTAENLPYEVSHA
jgi:hypothetical protein